MIRMCGSGGGANNVLEDLDGSDEEEPSMIPGRQGDRYINCAVAAAAAVLLSFRGFPPGECYEASSVIRSASITVKPRP